MNCSNDQSLTQRRTVRAGVVLACLSMSLLMALGMGFGVKAIAEAWQGRANAAQFNMPDDENGPMPVLLSQTGLFSQMKSMTPSPGLLGYEVNTPFWSDGAAKRRWIALPSGSHIGFMPTDEWSFPKGTIFVKHFELPLDMSSTAVRRLETRVLVRDSKGGVYGVTYRWRPDGTDADLVREAYTESITLTTQTGPQTRRWYYPSHCGCESCHNNASGGVLGVNTRQLNCMTTLENGTVANQLVAWDRLHMFDRGFVADDLPQFPTLSGLDGEASIENRARSYLDANCGFCHRPGGAPTDFDARFQADAGHLMSAPIRINLGIDHARLVVPNDPWRSLLFARMSLLDGNRMPPLAHEVVDEKGCELIRDWIKSMPGPTVLQPPVLRARPSESSRLIIVAIEHEDPAASIRYTLDGSLPIPSSSLYLEPITLMHSTTVRARAYKQGYNASVVVQDTFIVPRERSSAGLP